MYLRARFVNECREHGELQVAKTVKRSFRLKEQSKERTQHEPFSEIGMSDARDIDLNGSIYHNEASVDIRNADDSAR